MQLRFQFVGCEPGLGFAVAVVSAKLINLQSLFEPDCLSPIFNG